MKRSIHKKIIYFITDESGQAMAEYSLLLFVFVIACCGVFELIKNAWVVRWDKLTSIRAKALGMGP